MRPPLVKGMFVEVEISGRPTTDRIVIPRSAVHEGRVYTVDKDNRLRIRPVEVLAEQGGEAVIESGLEMGERVVLSDLSPAIDGMLLKPFPETPEVQGAAAAVKRKVAGEVQTVIEFFTKHPTIANLLMIAFLAVGALAAPTLQRETFPRVEPNKLEIMVSVSRRRAGRRRRRNLPADRGRSRLGGWRRGGALRVPRRAGQGDCRNG